MGDENRSDEGAPTQEPGDVETAGETTAADTISGPPNARPVGAGTTAPVEGDAGDSRPADD